MSQRLYDNWKEFIDEFEDFIETSEYSALDRRELISIPMLKDVALEFEIEKKICKLNMYKQFSA